VIREESVAEALIRQRIEDSVKALRAKDIDGVMSLYAPNIVSFDITPPLRYVGLRENVEPGKKPSLDRVAPWAMSYAT
jgi:ketosteroid isomerase-like protein